MLCTTVFRMYLCRNLDYGESWHVDQLSIDCTEPLHTQFEMLAGVGMVVYPFGVPLYFFINMYRQRQHLLGDPEIEYQNEKTQTDPAITNSTGDLHRDTNRAAVRDGMNMLISERTKVKQLKRRLQQHALQFNSLDNGLQMDTHIYINNEYLTKDNLPGISTQGGNNQEKNLDLSSRVKGGREKEAKKAKLSAADQHKATLEAKAKAKAEALSSKKQDICYHCKQPGHWKQDCPELTPDQKAATAAPRRAAKYKKDDGEPVAKALSVNVAESVPVDNPLLLAEQPSDSDKLRVVLHYNYELKQELLFMIQIKHPHVLQCHGVAKDRQQLLANGRPMSLLVTECCRASLHQYLRWENYWSAEKQSNAHMEQIKLTALLHATRGLAELHRAGLMHSDMSTANILLDEQCHLPTFDTAGKQLGLGSVDAPLRWKVAAVGQNYSCRLLEAPRICFDPPQPLPPGYAIPLAQVSYVPCMNIRVLVCCFSIFTEALCSPVLVTTTGASHTGESFSPNHKFNASGEWCAALLLVAARGDAVARHLPRFEIWTQHVKTSPRTTVQQAHP